MRSARELRGHVAAAGTDDELAGTSAECEMVLSKEDFEMLQAFHRFVPLPALTSRILRVLCEDDLQVPEASTDDADADEEAEQSRPAAASRINSSALRHPRRPGNLKQKPHYQINLAAQTPRVQPSRADSSRSSRPDSDRSERPEQS